MEAIFRESIFQEDLYKLPPRILVVIDRPWREISMAERELLQKILSAIRLTTDGVQILSGTQLDTGIISCAKSIISFGWNPEGKSLFEPSTLHETPSIYSHSLSQLLSDDEAKKKLWQGLKRLFLA